MSAISTSIPRELPTLQLPSALVSFWSPAGGDDPNTRQTAAAYASQTGIHQLGDRLFGILPEPGRENVFDDALTFGQAVLAHLRRIGAAGEVSGFLIFPGEMKVAAERVEVVREEFLDDLEEKPPRFKAQGLYLTGYGASWLRGRFQFDSVGLYDGPSGRRVPIHRMVGEAPELGPWHNPEVLSRQVKVARPQVREIFQQVDNDALQILGPLGSGKSHAVWHHLLEQEGPKLWFRAGRSLFGTGSLARRLVIELQKLAPDSLPPGGDELRQPEQLTPIRAAELLAAWLDNACQQLGATLWIVCDVVQSAVEADLDLLANLLARRGSIFRLLLITRSGGRVISQLEGMSRITIPPMNESEFTELGQQIFAGLSMDSKVERRLLAASAGYPFALEEGLTDLVHREMIRRVYGSFFYSGGSDVEYEPSRRLVRYVAAEARRLGDALPLRILAAANQAVPPAHLEMACDAFGVELSPGWAYAFTSVGWLREEASAWGEGLTFTCPAYGRALLETVAPESVESLRQALGQAMVSDTSPEEINWQTYQLMAGSADALPSLLYLSKKADTAEARHEIFAALEKEYRLHRTREGDATTELELLWKLLPLGHRLGRLSELEEELARACELAVGDATRFAALALVKAEHDLSQGRHKEATKGMQAALMASEGSPHQRRALIVIQLGKVLLYQEKIDEARKLFNDLLSLVDRQGATMLGANCHFYLGEVALYRNDLEAAQAHHEKALQFRRGPSHPRVVSASLSACGAVGLAQGDYPGALALYREALDILGDSSEGVELSEAHVGIGRAQGQLGDPTAATRHLRRGLELREGRDDIAAEQRARLHLAANHLDLGQIDPALKEARLAYLRLYMLPTSTYLGDAQRLIGKALFQTHHFEEGEEHFEDARRIHISCGQLPSAALDSSWLLKIALEKNDKSLVLKHSNEVEALFEDLKHPIYGELILYRLYRAFAWLRDHQTASREPLEYLRLAHRELMRKLGFLAPKTRHQFLFNVRDHEELISAAVENNLSMPSFSAKDIIQDDT